MKISKSSPEYLILREGSEFVLSIEIKNILVSQAKKNILDRPPNFPSVPSLLTEKLFFGAEVLHQVPITKRHFRPCRHTTLFQRRYDGVSTLERRPLSTGKHLFCRTTLNGCFGLFEYYCREALNLKVVHRWQNSLKHV